VVDGEPGAGEQKKKQAPSNRRLELGAWQIAWDRCMSMALWSWWRASVVSACLVRYTLAAAMLGQLSFRTAVLHKEHVLEIAAMGAAEEGCTALLGVLYDELSRFSRLRARAQLPWVCAPIVREHWADLSGKLGDTFKVEVAAASIADEQLRRARALHSRRG